MSLFITVPNYIDITFLMNALYILTLRPEITYESDKQCMAQHRVGKSLQMIYG